MRQEHLSDGFVPCCRPYGVRCLRLFLVMVVHTAALWGWQSAEQRPTLFVESGVNHSARSVAFSPDGQLLASSGIDRTIRVWSLKQHREIVTIPNEQDIAAFAFHPTERLLVSLDERSGVIRLWDLRTQHLVGSGDCGQANSAAFSSSGTYLLCVDEKAGAIRWWDSALTGELVTKRVPLRKMLKNVSLSGDGTLAAGIDPSGLTHVFELATQNELNIFRGKAYQEYTFSFAPTSDRIAALSKTAGQEIEIWKRVRHKGSVVRERVIAAVNPHAVAFSPDEHLLAYAAESGDIVLLDTTRWLESTRLSSLSNRVEKAGFVDGSALMQVQLWYNTILTWDLTQGQPKYRDAGTEWVDGSSWREVSSLGTPIMQKTITP